MSFLSSATFWGIIIILLGVSIILKEVFHIQFPFFRVIIGLLLIYWGIKVISGSTWKSRSSSSAVFGEQEMKYSSDEKEYGFVFGTGTVDLFKAEVPVQNKKIEVGVVFGNATLILNDSIPAIVEMSTVFGAVNAPGRSVAMIGNSNYTTAAYKSDQPAYRIEAGAVFGKIDIISKKW
ncbi:MAG: hypothetical protein DWQ48_08505 [Bacteroidetes bacterium]|nr:MAG: hypothetical protein DWQ48_08505 [Bacteroidota bacterium]